MSVSVVDSGSTVTISDGNSTINPYKDKITVSAQGSNVRIQWDARSYVQYPYTDFTAPTGASATAVADLIAAMLDTNPAEGVSGSGTTNYVSKWTSGTAIGNSQIFDNGTQAGVGVAAAPTALWHLAAGAAGASRAPLKFTTGTSQTTAEAGAMEFTTDDLFFTITTGAARKRLVMADAVGGLTSNTVPKGTTNGRLTDSTITDNGTTTTILTTNITLDCSTLILSGSLSVTSYGGWTHRNNFTLLDVTDTTKAARFVVSTVAAGATRLFTFPNNDGTFITSGNLTGITATGTITSGTWNGSVIGLTYGGTNANLTASNGGIFYSTDAAGAILAGTATAGQILRSGASTAPTWSTATYPATAATAGAYMRSDGTNYIESTLLLPNAATINQIVLATAADTYGGSAQFTYTVSTAALTNSLSTNAIVATLTQNANAGAAAQALFQAGNGTANSYMSTLGTGFTTAGLLVANRFSISTNGAGGMLLAAYNAAGIIIFATAGTAAANERMRIVAAGNVAITGQGTTELTVPTAYLHLAAGEAAASSGPLKFTTGTSNTTAEAGAMEFTTDDLFFTITTGAARKRLLMADAVGGLTSTRVPYATTNGRLTDSANMTYSGTRLSPNYVTLAAGAAGAGSAPLLFTTGTSLTTAVEGAMEFTDDDLFLTIKTSVARKRLVMADPVGGLTATRVAYATTNGRMTDNASFTFVADASGLTLTSRLSPNQGADIASGTNLTLGTDGNTFEITGTTQIDLILITNWRNGSVVTLVFNESLTVRHGIATAGSNVTILLAGAANFSATANDTLTLVLCETTAGGQAWRELARTAI